MSDEVRVKDIVPWYNARLRYESNDIRVAIATQEVAFTESDAKGGLPIFAFDKVGGKTPGARYYAYGGQVAFYRYLKSLGTENRHAYEIMRKGVPVHIYFDLEFKYQHNPNAFGRHPSIQNADDLTEVFKIHMLNLAITLGYITRVDQANVVIFDSSNAKKYSKHVHFIIKGKCLKNTAHAGAFARRLVNYILKYYMEVDGTYPLESNPLFFMDEHHSWNPLCDMTVYTSNRIFRLYGCSKREDKSRVLLPEGENRDEAKEQFLLKHFLLSMPQNVRETDVVLECKEDIMGVLSEPQSTSQTTFFRIDMPDEQTKFTAKRKMANYKKTVQKRRATLGKLTESGSKLAKPLAASEDGVLIIESIIREVAAVWGDGSQMMYLSENPEFGVMVLNTTSKKCDISKRIHKSNHVYFVVNLKAKFVRQMCHDGDCLAVIKSEVGNHMVRIKLSEALCKMIDDFYMVEEMTHESTRNLINDFMQLMSAHYS